MTARSVRRWRRAWEQGGTDALHSRGPVSTERLRPPRGRTWAPRGQRPVVRVRVRGRGAGRVNVAGVVCYRPGSRSRFFYKLHVYHGRRGEPKAFFWRQYRGLIVMAHLRLGTPLVWCWDNLNVHLARELADFAEEYREWLRIFQLPCYAPELNPAEGSGRCSPGAWPTSPLPIWRT